MKLRLLFLLIFGLSAVAHAQMECISGIKLYVRDQNGQTIQNARVAVAPANGQAKMPQPIFSFDYYYVGESSGKSLRGSYPLAVSAENFADFAGTVSFPSCDMRVYELTLKPKNSGEQTSLVQLTRLVGRIADATKTPRTNPIKAVLTDSSGKRQEFSADKGFYQFDVRPGEYSVEFLGLNTANPVRLEKFPLAAGTTRLNLNLQSNAKAGQKPELNCSNDTNSDGDKFTNCKLTVSVSP